MHTAINIVHVMLVLHGIEFTIVYLFVIITDFGCAIVIEANGSRTNSTGRDASSKG